MVSITFFFFVGGAAATVMRLELMTPAGRRASSPRRYNKLFTHARRGHGLLLPDPVDPGGAGQLPGPAHDRGPRPGVPLAQPAELVHLHDRRLVHALDPDLRRRRHRLDVLHAVQQMFSNTMVVPAAIGVFIIGFSSILTGLNFIVTIHTMRAPGMTWFRLPLFVWSHVRHQPDHGAGDAGAGDHARRWWRVERLLRRRHLRPGAGRRPDPVPAPVLVLLAPGGLHHGPAGDGGDQRDHPLLLAAADLRLHVHRVARAWRSRSWASWSGATTCSSAGQSMYAGMVFSILSFLVAIPSAIKVFNWTATLYKGSIRLDTPMLYALGFIGLFTIGGLTGLFLASLAIDVHVHDTYFVVAHFHYIMVGGAVMAYLGGIHFWWPKMTGRMYPELWGKLSALTDLRRLQPDVLPAVRPRLPGHAAAVLRVSARVPGAQRDVDGRGVDPGGRLRPAAGLSAALALGRAGRRARTRGDATGLEWQTASPPPIHNFDETARRDRAALRLLARGAERRPWRARAARDRDRHAARRADPLAHQFDDLEQQHEASTLGMWTVPGHRGHVLRRPVRGLTPSTGSPIPTAFALASRHLNVWLGSDQHRGPADQQPDDGPGRPRRPAGRPQATRCRYLLADDGPGDAFLGIKAFEYYEEYEKHLVPGLELQHRRSTCTMSGGATPHVDPADARCSSSSTSS